MDNSADNCALDKFDLRTSDDTRDRPGAVIVTILRIRAPIIAQFALILASLMLSPSVAAAQDPNVTPIPGFCATLEPYPSGEAATQMPGCVQDGPTLVATDEPYPVNAGGDANTGANPSLLSTQVPNPADADSAGSTGDTLTYMERMEPRQLEDLKIIWTALALSVLGFMLAAWALKKILS